jgi:hypothetical protein
MEKHQILWKNLISVTTVLMTESSVMEKNIVTLLEDAYLQAILVAVDLLAITHAMNWQETASLQIGQIVMTQSFVMEKNIVMVSIYSVQCDEQCIGEGHCVHSGDPCQGGYCHVVCNEQPAYCLGMECTAESDVSIVNINITLNGDTKNCTLCGRNDYACSTDGNE